MNADGSVIINVDVNAGEAEKELAKVRKDIKKTEEIIGKYEAKKSPLVQQAEELRHKMREARAEAERYGQAWANGVTGADKEQSDALGRVREMDTQYQKVVEKINKIDEKLLPAQSRLDEMTVRAGELNQRISQAGNSSQKMGEAIATAKNHADKFTKRVGALMKRVLVFSVILRTLNSIAQWFGKVIETSPEARDAIADLKGALLTLAQPLVEVILPAFTALVSVLARVVTMIAKVVSLMFGKTTDQSREAAEALQEQVDGLDGVAGSAKKAGKSLAGFDEINKLSGDGGGSSGSEIKPDFSGIQGAMSEMEVYMSGAMLALGALLTFTGVSVPLGLSLMAAGAMGLVSALAVDWSSMPDNLKNAITETMLVLGGAALVIGAILAISGANLPLGIGLMIAGAAALGTAVALNWDSIVEALRGPVGGVTALISGALLAIGAILTFATPGHTALGIGLMAAGAVGLAATAALNWDNIVEALRGPVGDVVALVSGALLAVGAVLAFSGANLPLGIGLMAAGAIGLASVVALNWDFISEMMRGKVGLVTAIASGALLALGLILLFTGAGAGLGLGLILAGAAGLATVVAFNWNFLSDKVKEIWNNVKSFWAANIAPVFTKEWWVNLAKQCGNGLIAGFEAAVNAIIGMFETMINWIVEAINTISIDVPEWVPGIGGETIGFDLDKVKFDRVSVPRLAAGAVIPPNREFMAMLGDQSRGYNIEAPEDLIRKIVREESGGGMNTALLQAILNAIKEGKVLMVGQDVFARLVYSSNQAESKRVGLSLTGG